MMPKKKRKQKKRKQKIKYTVKIENMVASADLGFEIDLMALARNVQMVEYEPEQFPGAILKLKDPKASLLLFKNGKVICTGSKSEAEVHHALRRAIKLLGYETSNRRYESS